MKFENTAVWGFSHAIRGMRNPKNSHDKSDTDSRDICHLSGCSTILDTPCEECPYFAGLETACAPKIGENDMKLAQTLIRAGSEHRKFLRQIFVSVDITAPLYWWKEFDTYKVGTVANSASTMHKIDSTPITIDCFETDDYHKSLGLIDDVSLCVRVDCLIDDLEQLRQRYLETKDKRYWKELIRWLPESWLQMRTITMNYENLLGICSKGQRRFHKLNEWSGIDNPAKSNFIAWARRLPYSKEFIFIDEADNNG